jgi:putative toxin-antitoxin system antitoxin component (TIGR02293 family)
MLPGDSWHNVPMAQAVSIPATPANVSGTDFDWKAVERGLPLSALEGFCAVSGLALKDLLEVVIPARTLKHRRQRKESLSLDESDRLVRVKRVFDLVLRVWSNRENAKEWLMTAQDRFEGKTPLAMLRTQAGERAVEEFLIQIDEGYFV